MLFRICELCITLRILCVTFQKYLEKLRKSDFKSLVFDIVATTKRSEAMMHQLNITQRFMFSFLQEDLNTPVDPESNVRCYIPSLYNSLPHSVLI